MSSNTKPIDDRVPAIYKGLGVVLFPCTDAEKSAEERALASDRVNRGFVMLPPAHAKALINSKTGRVLSQYADQWLLADQAESEIKHAPASVIETCSLVSQLIALKAKLDPSMQEMADKRIEHLRARRGG
jgi:hypothetical protein